MTSIYRSIALKIYLQAGTYWERTTLRSDWGIYQLLLVIRVTYYYCGVRLLLHISRQVVFLSKRKKEERRQRMNLNCKRKQKMDEWRFERQTFRMQSEHSTN